MRVFITGAGGLIGGDVAARLSRAGHAVTGLVRRQQAILGNDGVPAIGVRVVTGDITLDRFGWDAACWREEAGRHELLIHCAAAVKFGLPQAAYRAINIEGTERALALAREGGMAFCYVSTAYAGGISDCPVREGVDASPRNFANGYEESKAAAERLVRNSGLVHAIARPSIVVGDSEQGAIRRFDNICGFFRLIADGYIRVLPARPHAALDLVPIDHVANGIAAIALAIGRANGGVFHLISQTPVTVDAFAEVIGSYSHFSKPSLAPPEEFDPSSLRPAERHLYESVTKLYAGYFQRAPRFSDETFKKLTGIECPLSGVPLLKRVIAYAIRRGYLRAAKAA